jgi:hypothetical protein
VYSNLKPLFPEVHEGVAQLPPAAERRVGSQKLDYQLLGSLDDAA